MSPWKIIGWIVLALMLLSLTFCGLVCVRVAQDVQPGATQSQPSPVVASSPRSTPSNCGPLADNAALIMKARQAGKDMAKVLEAVGDAGGVQKERDLVIRAYESPRFSTEKNKTRAIDDFRNDIYLACIKG